MSRCALVLVHCLCFYDFPRYARCSVFTDSCCFSFAVESRVTGVPLLCVKLVLYFEEYSLHVSPKLAMQYLSVVANVIRTSYNQVDLNHRVD